MASSAELWGHPVVISDTVPEGEVWMVQEDPRGTPALRVVRWNASVCKKCGQPIYLVVDLEANRTRTEHTCPAGAEASRVNACR